MAVELKSSAKVLMFLVGVGLLAFAAKKYGVIPGRPTSEGKASGSEPKVTLELLYTTEKERWLEGAVGAFHLKHPDIRVSLEATGTIDGIRAIAEERTKPTIFSPADDVGLNLLDAEWSLAKGSPIVERTGSLAPQPLVLTPLVVIAWEDRAKVLAKAAGGDPTSWSALHDLATNPKGWLGLGGPAEWGYVKLGHTAPTSSNSGMQTLILMAYGYHRKKGGLKAEDVLDPGFQKFLGEVESAVGKFGTSSGTYMKDMVLFGPSKYDLVFNYENVAIGDMAAAQGRWGNLRVFYPRPTLWSNHPFAVLKGAWVTPEQRAAAGTLRDFLLSPPVQQQALALGFRPGNPDVRVLTDDPQNPFNRLKDLGVRADVSEAAEPPSGEVTRLLLETWRRVVGGAGR